MTHLRHLAILLAGMLPTACSQTPMRFYMLDAETASQTDVVKPPAGTVLGLGPIHLPAYLDRPQLVTAISDHQYQLDEQHRWAERLDENILRALSQSLARQLGIDQVVAYPWSSRQSVDYQLSVDIFELHQTAAGLSRFTAQWQLKSADKLLVGKRFECSEPAEGSAEAIVAAQSRCLGRLSVELANAVQQASSH